MLQQPDLNSHTLQFFTFDVMGDLVFGSPFGCLQDSKYHTWISGLFSAVKLGPFLQATVHFPLLRYLAPLFIPADLAQRRAYHQQLAYAKASSRKAQGASKPDLVSGLLQPDSEVTEQEFVATSALKIGRAHV